MRHFNIIIIGTSPRTGSKYFAGRLRPKDVVFLTPVSSRHS